MTEPAARTAWAPAAALVGIGWLLTVLAILAVVLGSDPGGRLLIGVAAVVLGAASLYGTIARPRLRADSTGVEVRGLLSHRSWAWAEVNVRLVRTRRLGREVAAVELDAENAAHPALVLLGKLELGADPVDVADALLALRT